MQTQQGGLKVNDHPMTDTNIVTLALTTWCWMIRFCSVSVLWALTAWPIVTIPLCSVAAIKAWQSDDDDLFPCRAYWHGFSRAQGSYWVGAPWILGLLVSAFEINFVMENHLPWSTIFIGLFIVLNAIVTIWVIYAWSAVAKGFSTIDAIRAGLTGVLCRPLKTVFLVIATVSIVGFATLLPLSVILTWGGGLALVGSSGTKALNQPSA